jgi:predicted O-methyltransferase YrrM
MLSLERNQIIKQYICDYFAKEDQTLFNIRQNSQKEGLPDIHIPANAGKLIYLLTQLKSPKKVLEIGTLGGYSTLWIARALNKNAKIISLELDAHHAGIARAHLKEAGFSHVVEIREGDAGLLLKEMIQKKEGPFDLIFIDADKENYPQYLDYALKLAESGTLILTDNLIPKGEAINKPAPTNKEATAIYAFNQKMAMHPRLESIIATTIVGNNGRIGGLGIAIVKH